MADLVCIGFDDAVTAERVLAQLTDLQKEYLIEIEDACVVTRTEDGRVSLKQAFNLTSLGATSGGTMGALWGGVIGLLFLNPLAGMAIGAGTGALSGALSGAYTDYGIDDDFIRQLGATIPPGSSALFLLVRKVNADKVLRRLEGTRGRVLRTSLTDEQEAKLRDALTGGASPVGIPPAGATSVPNEATPGPSAY